MPSAASARISSSMRCSAPGFRVMRATVPDLADLLDRSGPRLASDLAEAPSFGRRLVESRAGGDTGGAVSDAHPRLAELVGALSLSTDLAAGLAYETALRTGLLAAR